MHSHGSCRCRNWFDILLAMGFVFVFLPVIRGEQQKKIPEFVATEEWQEVLPGQNIPPGLHVRLDLNTNRREAKLINSQDNEHEQYAVSQSYNIANQKSSSGVNQGSQYIPDPLSDEEKAHAADVRSRFRSYEELKAEFDAMNAQVKSDYELISDIVIELKKQEADESRMLVLLEDLDYLLHQVDNGRQFAKDGGLTLLGTLLQSPQQEVKRAVLSTMSAAIQGNTFAKIIALQNGSLDTVHNLLNEISQHPVTNADTLKLIQRGVGTLGTLLRDFPSAQLYFFGNQTVPSHLSPPGFIFLSRLFDLTQSPHQTELSVDVRVRILTLLSDLARERSSARERSRDSNDTVGQRLWTLYSSFPFESDLVSAGWCQRLRRSLLTDMHFSTNPAAPQVNHDRREKLLQALLYLHPMCERTLFAQNTTDEQNVVLDLMRMEEEYANMLSNPSSSSLFPQEQQKPNSDSPIAPGEDSEELKMLAKEMRHLIIQLLELQRNASRYDTERDPAEL
ncbi:hypothetical protein FGIG_03580 [Fasciola gigantica]|uniref:Nucleotide exchange factor SIL1 n=1 Tax=Fasciola gigantica TaxID=46835 RepID=A0A504YDY2_FASGI|nr:hypothetical protein FGIG_03580 [Fasciola gigantica]